MEIQVLNSCCSTVYLYNLTSPHEWDIQTKQAFFNFLRKDDIMLNKMYGKKVVMYICDDNSISKQLKKIGFKRKCTYLGQDRFNNREAEILMLDLRVLTKDLNKVTLKQKIKNWVATW